MGKVSFELETNFDIQSVSVIFAWDEENQEHIDRHSVTVEMKRSSLLIRPKHPFRRTSAMEKIRFGARPRKAVFCR